MSLEGRSGKVRDILRWPYQVQGILSIFCGISLFPTQYHSCPISYPLGMTSWVAWYLLCFKGPNISVAGRSGKVVSGSMVG